MMGSLLQKRRLGGLCALAVLAGLALSACSSGDEGGDGSTAAPSSGVSGTGGANNGQGGASGGSGGAVSGSAGKAAGTAGAAGKATGGAAGGAGGNAGTSGGGGKAGASGGAGKGGSAGVDLSCETSNDCAPLVPETKPASCASAFCDPASKKCRFKAKDFDGDGHATTACKSLDAAITIELGDDCNDADDVVHPGAWDGPAGEGHQNACNDMRDNDCNGADDDSVLSDGTGCKCVVGDTRKCSADSGGKPISYPGGTPQGECRYGSQTCVEQGGNTVWGPCTNAVGPTSEECNGKKDDDCDGLADDDDPDVINQSLWYCDGDNDNFAAVGSQAVKACDVPSKACPGTAGTWKLDIPTSDCNDARPDVNPNAPEVCDGDPSDVNGVDDENCNGTKNEGCSCKDGETQDCFLDPTGQPIPNLDGIPLGSCKAGKQTCEGGAWGACLSGKGPIARDCSSPLDDDCDGSPDNTADDFCACPQLGASEPCDTHPGKDGVAACKAGVHSCEKKAAGGTGWGACIGSVGPEAEVCNSEVDHDCDGEAGNSPGCIVEVEVYRATAGSGTEMCATGVSFVKYRLPTDPPYASWEATLIAKVRLWSSGARIVRHCTDGTNDGYQALAVDSTCDAIGKTPVGYPWYEKRILGYVSASDGPGKNILEIGPLPGSLKDEEFYCSGDGCLTKSCPPNPNGWPWTFAGTPYFTP